MPCARSAEGAFSFGGVVELRCEREPGGDEDGEGGEGGEDVVLLAGGEGEEEQDEGGPDERGAWRRGASSGEIVAAELAAEGLGASASLPKMGAAQAVALKRKADQGMSQMRQRPQKS